MPKRKGEPIFRGIHTSESVAPDRTQRLREEGLRKLESHQVRDEELEAVLNEIDFNLISEIISRDIRKSGGDTASPPISTAHTCDRASIILTNKAGVGALHGDPTTVMGYMPEYDLVLVNVEVVKRMKRQSPHLPFPLLVLHSLMHEENHAASALYFSLDEEGRVIEAQVGMEQLRRFPDRSMRSAFQFWNEAINEKRALEQTYEYLGSSPLTGVSQAHRELLKDPIKNDVTTLSYWLGIYIADQVIEKISIGTGVTTDAVWQSLIHAGVQGLNLNSKDAKRELDLDSIFGSGFTAGLVDLEESKIVDYVKKFDLNFGDSFVNELYAQVLAAERRIAIE